MASINKVILIGNLGRDPESRTFPSGGQITNVRLATTEKWRDRQSGEMREHTEWHSLVFGDRLAEIAAQYLRKGSQVYVEGRLRTRKWQDQSGQDRYTTEVRVDTMQMLGSRGGSESGFGDSSDSGYGGGAPRRQESSGSYESGGQGGFGGGSGAAPAPAPAPARQQDEPAQRRAAPPPPAFSDNFEDDDIPF